MDDDRDPDLDDEESPRRGSSAVGSMMISTLIGGPVSSITPDATLYEVAAKLSADGIGALVVDGGERLAIAVVTERDVIRALGDNADPAQVRVHNIASTDLVWCDADASVGYVAELMSHRYLRHVLVKDQGKLAGIVSARDVLGAYAAAEE